MTRECFAILDKSQGRRGYPVIKCVEGRPGFIHTHEEILGSEEIANKVVDSRNAEIYGLTKAEADAIVQACQDLTKGRTDE